VSVPSLQRPDIPSHREYGVQCFCVPFVAAYQSRGLRVPTFFVLPDELRGCGLGQFLVLMAEKLCRRNDQLRHIAFDCYESRFFKSLERCLEGPRVLF
jgi:hypothetical protein